MCKMNPKSLPVAISGVLSIAVGTALIGVGIGIPEWIISYFPRSAREEIGLFEKCKADESCKSRENETDELKIVTGLSLSAGIVGCLAVFLAILMLFMSLSKAVNKCMEMLPWLTLLWSLVSGGAVIAALILFEEKEYDSDDFTTFGISFVLVAAGGGCVVIGGVLFCVGGHYLLAYLRRQETKGSQFGDNYYGESLKY